MAKETDFTADQHNAVHKIDEWYRSWPDGKQTFALAGLAGCGKSYLVSYIQSQYRNVRMCAPTGKAADVQRQNGVDDACTLHSLIYNAKVLDGKTTFTKRGSIDGDLIIVDEAGMLATKENNDLLSFNKPVLYVGDHGQLEPIGDNPNLMAAPDCVLETIHRQAADSPILRLAMAFREGREAKVLGAMREKGWYRDPTGRMTLAKKHHAASLIGPHTQVICGFNATRHRMNQEIRKARGFDEPIPMPGESVICLSNWNKFGMFNGQLAVILGINKRGYEFTDAWIGFGKGQCECFQFLNAQFGRNTLTHFRDKQVLLLDWSYALTCHKTQGSGFDDVLVMEEISENWDVRRWRYTSVTRAKERITYCW